MLVLSRKVNEAVVIDDQIVVKIVAIQPDRVRLGIAGPMHVPVHRQEVHTAIRQQAHDDPPALRPYQDESAIDERPLPDDRVEFRLTADQLALVDRLRNVLRGDGQTTPTRQETIHAVFQAVEQRCAGLVEAGSLADLCELLAAGDR